MDCCIKQAERHSGKASFLGWKVLVCFFFFFLLEHAESKKSFHGSKIADFYPSSMKGHEITLFFFLMVLILKP